MKKARILFAVLLLLSAFSIFSCKDRDEQDNPDTDNDEIKEVTDTKTFYASPSGDRATAGTKEDPYDIYYAFEQLRIGYTLILLPGAYKTDLRIILSRSGSSKNPITIKTEKDSDFVELDFSAMSFSDSNRGIQVNGDHYYIKGIKIKGAGDNGMYIGGSFNVIENCEFYNNRDTGLQLGRSSGSLTRVEDWPHNNLIKNCTSYNNYDEATFGENADGFAAKLTVGQGNVFDGCIAYRNSDDGWDLYAKTDSGNIGSVILYNCIAFENGYLLDGKTTRDGDGIGFKLGGSAMKGDALLYNCAAWNNSLDGVADNSNPGVLSINNCTFFNNSVKVTNNSIAGLDGESRNIELARTSGSYNNASGVISYNNLSGALNDAFKGAVAYSILATSATQYNRVIDFTDIYTEESFGSRYYSLNDDSFAELPHDFGKNRTDIHTLFRNSDQSINIGNILKIVDKNLLDFNNGEQIGARLDCASWDEYKHYELSDYSKAETYSELSVLSAYDSLVLNCNTWAVFQDFQVYLGINGCTITWTSSDESVLKFGTEIEKSFSSTEQIYAEINRNREKSEYVSIAAAISYGSYTRTKTFNLIVIKDEPKLGDISNYENKYILDKGDSFTKPTLMINNGASITLKPLSLDLDYTINYTYKYATNTTAVKTDVDNIDINTAGVYFVTATIISILDPNDKKVITYNVFVAAIDADVEFVNSICNVNVTKDGYLIEGTLSNVTGFVYAYKSQNSTETKETIQQNGQKITIMDDVFRTIVASDNTTGYYVHIVVGNKAGQITSEVYTRQIITKNISSEQDFYDMVTNPSSATTIYLLTKDLDFTNFTWNAIVHTNNFVGLFDGNNHAIRNINITGTNKNNVKNISIFYKVSSGTIMNVSFENIRLVSSSDGKITVNNVEMPNYVTDKVAIVGHLANGYIHNVKLVNISAIAKESAAALVGQVTGGISYITQVSLTNSSDYVIAVNGRYCAGLVALIQKETSEALCELYISDCIVRADIGDSNDGQGYIGGIVGRAKNDFAVCILSITRCYYSGTVTTGKNYAGGILAGCDNGIGKIYISYCVSDTILMYAGTPYQASNDTEVIGHKNGSPIIGRLTAGSGIYDFAWNYATFDDSNAQVGSIVINFANYIKTKAFYQDLVKYDLTNIWLFDETTNIINLR